MQLPSQPRRASARNKPLHFQYVTVERGEPFEAYLAGPIWWGFLHMTKPSKPCVFELTGGKIECRFCGTTRIPIMKGWIPLYRRIDGLPMCACVDEALRDNLDGLKLHTKVQVGRGKGKGVGVWCAACLNQEPVYSSTLPERQQPADISHSLITMWNMPEVTAFFARPVSDTAASLNAKGDTTDGNSLVTADGSSAGRGSGVHLLGDSFMRALPEEAQREIRRRRNEQFVTDAERPKKNGKH